MTPSAAAAQYAERDPMELDRDGNYYCRHVRAMTAEGLHEKSAIAAELAWRDREIDRLRSLAQPQGEAVAWQYRYHDAEEGPGLWINAHDRSDAEVIGGKPGYEVRELFTHPAAVDDAFKVGDRALWTDNFGRQHRGRITVVNPVTYDFRLDDGLDAEDYPAERFALLPATSEESP